jgi:hypothetical protein
VFPSQVDDRQDHPQILLEMCDMSLLSCIATADFSYPTAWSLSTVVEQALGSQIGLNSLRQSQQTCVVDSMVNSSTSRPHLRPATAL